VDRARQQLRFFSLPVFHHELNPFQFFDFLNGEHAGQDEWVEDRVNEGVVRLGAGRRVLVTGREKVRKCVRAIRCRGGGSPGVFHPIIETKRATGLIAIPGAGARSQAALTGDVFGEAAATDHDV